MTRAAARPAGALGLILALVATACAPGEPSPSASPSPASPSAAPPPTGRIAFTRLTAASGQPTAAGIWIVDAAGGDPEPLIDSPDELETFPAWSPDGSRIAYVAGPSFDRGDLFVANADGSEPRRLTDTPTREWAPTWSPDGLRIAFVTTDGGSQTWTTVVDEAVPPRGIVPAHWPAWAPDGQSLIVTVGDSLAAGQLAGIDLIEGNTAALPIELPNASEAAVHTDGRIAFVSSATDYADDDPATWNEDIWLFEPGSEPLRLSTTPENDHWPPSFSPDGAWLAYTHDTAPPAATSRIALVPTTGGDPIYLTAGETYDGFPAWHPDPETAP